jgi:protein arginine kinase activator
LICGECGERPATVRFTETRGGELRTFRLCERCARRRRARTGLPSFAGPLVNILMGLLEESLDPGGGPRDISDCPQCGLSYSEFRLSGRLGCAACYESFGEELEPLLRRVHGSTAHVGRCPSGEAGTASPTRRRNELRLKLARAVGCEDYERAAELRDELRELAGGPLGGRGVAGDSSATASTAGGDDDGGAGEKGDDPDD